VRGWEAELRRFAVLGGAAVMMTGTELVPQCHWDASVDPTVDPTEARQREG
jgi:hypothetical protein